MSTSNDVPTGSFDFGPSSYPELSTSVKLGQTQPASTPPQREDPSKKARLDHDSNNDMEPSTLTPSPHKSGHSMSLGGRCDRTKPSMIGDILFGQSASQQPQRGGYDEPQLPASSQSYLPSSGISTQLAPAPDGPPPCPALSDTVCTLFLKEPEITSVVDWWSYEGKKVLAVPEWGCVNFQTAALVSLVEDIIRQAFPNNPKLDVFPGGTTDERLHPHHPFPAIITGLSNEEVEALLNEFCLATAHQVGFFYPFNITLPVSTFTVSLH
ncbi:hypothetical protein M422DRAFT_273944 [Sphaerobolus stellatus SS14]|uniref:Uncharacterized protein n=1 Tax=Sphaerobolus stellatus (strain SS14) TaxID=990650 RepID=A0A0C9U7Q5_SPHS4|nr:hypothetical protein M422DRAFT_273944 [Sphaerobolus stellatus SS14]